MASYGHYGQRAARLRLDCIYAGYSACSLVSLFWSRPRSYCAKLAQIRFGWPPQVLAKQIWSRSKLLCKNHWVCFWQNASCPLPVSHFQTQLHSSTDGPGHIVQHQTGSDLVLADCQVWAEVIQSGSKPVCLNHPAHFWPTLSSWSGSDANQIQHVYWVTRENVVIWGWAWLFDCSVVACMCTHSGRGVGMAVKKAVEKL